MTTWRPLRLRHSGRSRRYPRNFRRRPRIAQHLFRSSLMRTGILAAGNFIVDRVKLIDDYPHQDTLASILSETSSNGGGAYNVLTNLSRMGASYSLSAAGLIGNDPDGEWIRNHCREHHINSDLLLQSAIHPTSYTDVMTVDSNGRRTFFHQRGANSSFTGEHVDFTKTGARIFHLGYLLLLDSLDTFAPDVKTNAAHLLARASSAGLTTSLDLVSQHIRSSARSFKVRSPKLTIFSSTRSKQGRSLEITFQQTLRKKSLERQKLYSPWVSAKRSFSTPNTTLQPPQHRERPTTNRP